MRHARVPLSRLIAVAMGCVMLAGCGGGSTTTTPTPIPTPTPVANSITVTVNAGPANNAVNMAYVSVTVCNPSGSSTCVTIPNVQVDTGSSGLRILASAPQVSTLNLSQVTAGATPVYECYAYPDGAYLWGPVMQGGVSMSGESATNVPIQVIDNVAAPASVLSSCDPIGGNNLGTSTLLQANGILGIGPALQDCGVLCTGSTVLPYYWLCTSSSTCTSPAAVPTPTQVSNPVAFFNGSDNNGVMLTMGSLGSTNEANSGSGTLYFGIGTQTDNALGSSTKAYALSLNTLNGIAYDSIFATYNGNSYPAYVDSAENFLFLLDPATVAAYSAGAGITSCPGAVPLSEYYCTSSAPSLPFTIKDSGTDSSTVTLTIGNGTTLYNSSVANGGSNTAFSNLAGGYSGLVNDEVILGMPFFYGRTVYVGIAGQAPPSGLSATTYGALGYWAF